MKIVTTSWDDGHKLDLKLARLLKKYRIGGTLYISPKNREWDKKDLLTDEQIIGLNKNFEIGAHTLSHPILTEVNETESFKEIKESKIYLEKLLKSDVDMFCYPKGLYNKRIKNQVKKIGFIGARNCKTFQTATPKDYYELGTTMHTTYRKINYSIRLALINNPRFIPFLFTKDWVTISKRTFDYIDRHGGIWHFWGHSWQIEKYNWWQELEEVLQYISKRSGVDYYTNGETLKYTYEKYL